jgi:hypothetical protein
VRVCLFCCRYIYSIKEVLLISRLYIKLI